MAPAVERVVVHVGMHKCASTSLQAALRVQLDGRPERDVAYPSLGGKGKKRQSPLARALSYGAKREDARAQVLPGLQSETVRAASTLVLSGEGLYATRPKELQQLLAQAQLGTPQLRPMAIVRDPAEWLNSLYVFEILQGFTNLTFGAFVEDALRRGMCDYRKNLRRWMKLSGAKLVLFADKRDAAPLLARAITAMNLGPAPAVANEKTAADPRTVALAHRLFLTGIAEREREGFARVRRAISELAAERCWNGRFQGLDPAPARQARPGNDRRTMGGGIQRTRHEGLRAKPPRPLRPEDSRGGRRVPQHQTAAVA